jgi:hypothetical protein
MFTKTYQPKNPQTGEPYGPPQKFEAETMEALVDKIAVAHENAAVAFYDTKKQLKAERVMTPDTGRPLRQFASRQLTGDERVKIANLRKDPNTAIDATRIEVEALLGAPVDAVLAQLNEAEANRIAGLAREAVAIFLENTPEYIECDVNQEAMEKFLLKKELPVTVKNLQIAFDSLSEDKKLALRQPKPTTEAVPAAIPTVEPQVEPVSEQTSPISDAPAPTPRTASTGLSARGSSAPQNTPTPVKVGLTHRDIAKMSAAEIAKGLSDPEFVKQLDALPPRG